MALDNESRFVHVRNELQRGHVSRCPRSWIITTRAMARERGDDDLAAACDIALEILRSDDRRVSTRIPEMARLAGRRTVRQRRADRTR